MSSRRPSYRYHKARNCAVVTLDGRDHYLGPYQSDESYEAYDRLLAQWERRSVGQASTSKVPTNLRTINEVVLAYWEFAKSYYIQEGKPGKELSCMKEAIRPLRRLCGNTKVCDFGPKALKAVRQDMIDVGLSRGVINQRVNRIKRILKWAVGEELVPPSVYHGVQAVAGLRYGRSTARETEPVKPVADAWVDAVLPFVAPQVAAMVHLQRLTGMRTCELTIMRGCDIDMSGEIWVYEPYTHKNRWRGHRRLVPLGPKAQAIIKPFLKMSTEAFLFSPADAEAWRNGLRRQKRRTPMTPSQAARTASPEPKRPKRDRYDSASYRRAIEYGLKKAKKKGVEIPHWHPYQLRHRHATDVRRQFGVEAAQVSLGHARGDIVEVYAEKNLELAISVARACG